MYTCQHNAFPIYKTLKNNIQRRTNKVFLRATILIYLVYSLVSLAGFLTFPTNPEDLIIYRKSIFKNDIFMTISKIGIALYIFLIFPANYVPYRCSFFELFFKTDEIDNCKNLLVTGLTLMITCFIAAIYKDVLGYISIIGGFLSTFIAYIIPGLIYVKSSELPGSHPKIILTYVLVIILTVIGFASGFQTIIEVINWGNQ